MTYVRVVPSTRPLPMLPRRVVAVHDVLHEVDHVVVRDRGLVDILDPQEDHQPTVAVGLQEVHRGPQESLTVEVTSRAFQVSPVPREGL